jgi:hypothetical protein
MPRHYDSLQKVSALQTLDLNNGNIILTSQETGIPVRTLYAWRREREQQNLLQSLQLQQTVPMQQPSLFTPPPEFADDADAYGFLRQQVLRELTTVAANLNMGAATPAQRLAALNQLFEYLTEVDKRLSWVSRANTPRQLPTPESPEEVMQTYIRYYRKYGKWIGPGSPPPLDNPAPEEETYDPALSLTIRPAAS